MVKILLLDDSKDLLATFKFIFITLGYAGRGVTTEALFLEELDKELPDLVIIDVALGIADGREVCRALKEKEQTKHIPVILMSGTPALLDDFKACNADAILQKPFNVEYLGALIEQLIPHA